MLVYFCLPKKYRKASLYIFFLLFLLFVVLITSYIYVSTNLDAYIKDDILYMINTTSIPIRVYSINKKVLNIRLGYNDTYLHIFKNEEKEKEIELVLKFCVLKFATTMYIK